MLYSKQIALCLDAISLPCIFNITTGASSVQNQSHSLSRKNRCSAPCAGNWSNIGQAFELCNTSPIHYTAALITCIKKTHTHKYRFNGNFPGKARSISCLLDSQSPVILILSILTGQAKTLCTHMVLWAVSCPLTLTTIPRGFEEDVFTGQKPFPSPNQQCQSTEGISKHRRYLYH